MATFGFAAGVGTSVETGEITDGAVTNAKVSDTAAIAYSKLALATSIVNADISATAAIALSKISGAAASGANSDITSLAGLTTPLSVAQGGTGAATLGDAGVLIGNGTGAVAVTGAGTSGQVLTSNGAGVDPTFQALVASTLITEAGAATAINDNNTAEQNLISVSIPGGTLGTNNALRVHIDFSGFAMDGSTCLVTLRYGGTTLASFTLGNAVEATQIAGFIEGYIYASASATAQRGTLRLFASANDLTVNATQALFAYGQATGTAAIDSALAQTLLVTVDYDVNGSSVITIDGFTVESLT